MSEQDYKAELDRLAKRLAQEGKLILAGWIGYRIAVMPPEAGQVQLEECRRAFMAGATHLFFSLLTALDSGTEPTEADLGRMELIHRELELFNEQMKAGHAQKTKRN